MPVKQRLIQYLYHSLTTSNYTYSNAITMSGVLVGWKVINRRFSNNRSIAGSISLTRHTQTDIITSKQNKTKKKHVHEQSVKHTK